MRYPFLDRGDAMPLARCIRPDHTEGETKYHDVEFKTNIVVYSYTFWVSDFLVRLFSSCWVVLLLLPSLLLKWSTFPCFANHWPGLKNGPLESKPVNICSIVYDIFKHIQIVFCLILRWFLIAFFVYWILIKIV